MNEALARTLLLDPPESDAAVVEIELEIMRNSIEQTNGFREKNRLVFVSSDCQALFYWGHGFQLSFFVISGEGCLGGRFYVFVYGREVNGEPTVLGTSDPEAAVDAVLASAQRILDQDPLFVAYRDA